MPWYMLALFSAVLLTLCIDFSEPCSCLPSHPQEQFCNSDFVILARIKHRKSYNGTVVYKARIKKSFKMSEKAEVALKSGRLLSPEGSSLCEAELIPGKLYALSGRVLHLKARISLCSMSYRWEHLSRRQRKGFKMMYRQGCMCKISRCYSHSCEKRKNSCVWPISNMECYEREGICLSSPSKICRWARNAPLAKCRINSHLPFLSGLGRKFVQ